MDVPIRHGQSVDFAKDDPTFLVCIANHGSSDRSAYSDDSGATWTEFAAIPATDFQFGGSIAASTTTNFCWFPHANGTPEYTTDGGATWAVCTFPGVVPTTGTQGWGDNFLVSRTAVCADAVTANTFYAYNSGGDGGASAEGFYRSTDGGANWTRRGAGPGVIVGGMGIDNSFVCVPGNAGHFFWSTGRTAPNPYDEDMSEKVFIFSDDGGTNAYKIAGFMEAWSASLGMAAPSASYPAVFVAGWRDGDDEGGIYRCDDWDPTTRDGTWTRLEDDYGTIDAIGPICGDMEEYGTVYVGLKASGVIMGALASATRTIRLRGI
jgi:xyloglucan-specific exo-beta-1,4-glucanase